MSDSTPTRDRHPAAVWSDMLMGQPVEDLTGRHLGVIEAVVTSPAGRLHRIGLRTSRSDYRLHFYSAEGAKLGLHVIVLPLTGSALGHLVPPADPPVRGRFRLFFDRRRKALLRTP